MTIIDSDIEGYDFSVIILGNVWGEIAAMNNTAMVALKDYFNLYNHSSTRTHIVSKSDVPMFERWAKLHGYEISVKKRG